MRKIIVLSVIAVIAFALAGCGETENAEPTGTETTAIEATQAAATEEIAMSIDGEELSVAWEDNESVDALHELVASKPLEISMSMYGGFEQVGSLGTTLPSNDEEMTTEAGDIVLYSGDQIVLFYGSNSWAYTKLGHVEGKATEELEKLLGQQDVTLKLAKHQYVE